MDRVLQLQAERFRAMSADEKVRLSHALWLEARDVTAAMVIDCVNLRTLFPRRGFLVQLAAPVVHHNRLRFRARALEHHEAAVARDVVTRV